MLAVFAPVGRRVVDLALCFCFLGQLFLRVFGLDRSPDVWHAGAAGPVSQGLLAVS